MNNIIKLTNGETIIAEVVHQDENITSILEPLQLIIEESERTGRPVMVALSWIPLTKKVNMVNLKTQHVVAVAECDEEIDKYYIRSLAVMKGDHEKLKQLLAEEKEIHDWDDEGEDDDPWIKKFGKPLESANSANTMVH